MIFTTAPEFFEFIIEITEFRDGVSGEARINKLKPEAATGGVL